MHHASRRLEPALPTQSSSPSTQINFLKVQEKALVEPPGCVQQRGTNCHAGARHPTTKVRVWGLRRSYRPASEKPAQQAQAGGALELSNRGVNVVCSRRRIALRILYGSPNDADRRLRKQPISKRCYRAHSDFGVGIEEQHHCRQTACGHRMAIAQVVSVAESSIERGLEHGNPMIPSVFTHRCADRRCRAITRVVIDHNHRAPLQFGE